MTDEPKKLASDLLLEMSAKVDTILALVRNIELNNKVINNKLNQLMQSSPVEIKTFSESVANVEEQKIFVETAHASPRRTSRDLEIKVTPKKVVEKPNSSNLSEVIVTVPTKSTVSNSQIKDAMPVSVPERKHSLLDNVPVSQMITHPNGKAMFLALVTITNADTNEIVKETKTSGLGKWQVSLNPGNYKYVVVRRVNGDKKNEVKSLTYNSAFVVDGKSATVELPNIILE